MLELKNISKSFPGVKALQNVSVDFLNGEIHAILGENGAGKSTLMKIICGIYQADESDVTYYSDGIPCVAKAGESIYVSRGNSVRLDPFVNHTFGAKKGDGPLISGEVSKVNDDNTDNYFAEPTARFADIEEDEPVLYPLCNEYDKWFPKKG